MQRNRPPSAQAINVLRALAADPSRWRYGYDLGTQVRLKSGSLYPILVRLADRGLLEATWERGPEGLAAPSPLPAEHGRPGVRGSTSRSASRPGRAASAPALGRGVAVDPRRIVVMLAASRRP